MPDATGADLYESVPEKAVLDGLEHAEEQAVRLLNQATGQNGDDLGGKTVEIWDAIIARLRFRRAYLQLILQLAKGDAKGFGGAAKYLPNAKLQLDVMEKTCDLGSDASRFFDENINRHLFTNGPPRKPPVITIADALATRKAFLRDTESMLLFTNYTSFESTVVSARFSDFASYSLTRDQRLSELHLHFFGLRLPAPHILARSILANNLVSDTQLVGRFDLFKVAQDGIDAFTAPPYGTAPIKDNRNRFNMFCKRCEAVRWLGALI